MDFLKILALLVCLLVASASATMTSHRTVASAAPSSLHKHLHDVKKLKKSAPGCCPSPHVAGTAFGGTCVCVGVCARVFVPVCLCACGVYGEESCVVCVVFGRVSPMFEGLAVGFGYEPVLVIRPEGVGFENEGIVGVRVDALGLSTGTLSDPPHVFLVVATSRVSSTGCAIGALPCSGPVGGGGSGSR